MTVTTDWLQGIGSISQGIGVAFAAWLAWRGISTWRDQLLGKRKVEVAEQALAAAYRVKEAFDFIRSPLSYAHEARDRERPEGEPQDLARLLDTAFIPIDRINRAAEAFTELRKASLLCKVLFGDEAGKPFDELMRVRHEVIVAAQMLGETAQERIYERFENRDLVRQWERLIWAHGKDDPLTPIINKAVTDLEKLCSKHLERGGS